VVKVIDFKSLTLKGLWLESCKGIGILSFEEAIQVAYGTWMVLLRCPFVPGIMHRGASEVFFNQLSWKVTI
jgi:hypothetical protein